MVTHLASVAYLDRCTAKTLIFERSGGGTDPSSMANKSASACLFSNLSVTC